MSRKKMINFDSKKDWHSAKRKVRADDDVVYRRIERCLGATHTQVVKWFKDGRMPEKEYNLFKEWLVVTPRESKALYPEGFEPLSKEEIREKLPTEGLTGQAIMFSPEEDYVIPTSIRTFLDHCFDYNNTFFDTDSQIAFMDNLRRLIEKEVDNGRI